MPDHSDSELYQGLRELSAGEFPKVCSNCGRVYQTLDEFLQQTNAIAGKSGLKAARDDDDRPIVELFRNCVCGSTLMDFCRSRRDESAAGHRRRENFERTMKLLMVRGMDGATAHAELLKLMRGQGSEPISRMLKAK